MCATEMFPQYICSIIDFSCSIADPVSPQFLSFTIEHNHHLPTNIDTELGALVRTSVEVVLKHFPDTLIARGHEALHDGRLGASLSHVDHAQRLTDLLSFSPGVTEYSALRAYKLTTTGSPRLESCCLAAASPASQHN